MDDLLDVLCNLVLVGFNIDELVLVVVLDLSKHHFVDVHVDYHDGSVGAFERLHVGRVHGGLLVGLQQIVDFVRVFRQFLNHILQWNQPVAKVHTEPQQLYEFFLVLLIRSHSFLQKVLEVLVPDQVTVRVSRRLVLQLSDYSRGQDVLQLRNQSTVLVVLSRNVQRQVFAVHNTF